MVLRVSVCACGVCVCEELEGLSCSPDLAADWLQSQFCHVGQDLRSNPGVRT